jgi:chemotaxis protein methyltransferase CheR
VDRADDRLDRPGAAVLLVRDLVRERTGLSYDDSRVEQMADRLAPLVAERGFDSFLDYYYMLKYDTAAAPAWDRLMDALSVPETYFWREMDQLRAIADVIIPALARGRARPIRIWCVPCATGEEPLTLAMLLDERGWFGRAAIEIRASDASPAALETARAGVYRERSFRALPAELRERYFACDGTRWRISPSIHARVSAWTRVNLLAAADVAPFAGADIVLCRNVFIYFSQDAIRRVVDVFADCMPVPSYLCVGAAESLLRTTVRFELQQVGDAFVYVKGSAATEGPR